MRYSVTPIGFAIVIAIIITINYCGLHDNDTMAIQWSHIVLVHFKEVRAEGGSAVVLVELRVFRVVVDPWDLAMAVVVREDEDDAHLATGIHRPEVEVGVVVDGDLEAVAAKLYSVLALGHNGIVAVVREDGLDLRGLESGEHAEGRL